MTAVYYLLLLLAGATVGSFAGNLGLRLAAQRGWAAGRSSCDHCSVPLGYAQTIPVFSFLRLRGRCANCAGPIDRVQLFGEASGAAALPLFVLVLGPLRGALVFVMAMTVLAASVTDLKTRRLPDVLTAIVALLGVAIVVADRARLLEGLLASSIAGLSMLALRRFSARQGVEPGLGLGDVKLFAALALWLGILAPWSMALSAAIGLVAIRLRPPEEAKLAFGPFLAAGAITIGTLGELLPWLRG